MKPLVFLTLLMGLSLSAQSKMYPSREKGEVFKNKPDKPMEDVNRSGLVVVTRSMYGLTFADKKLSAETKQRIERFFKQQNKGYTDFKTYELKIRRQNNVWYIENYRL